MEQPAKRLQAISTPDYMRIRKYVMTLINSNVQAPAKLPPMEEIAQQFGVTRMTVHKALKDLIRDKYLISRKGVGTFINTPFIKNNIFNTEEPHYQIAVIVGEGKHCFYDIFYWEHVAAVGSAIALKGHQVNVVNLLSVKPDEMIKELRNNFVDAAIWIDAGVASIEVMHSLHKEKFPVVSVHKYLDNINSVGMDYAAHATEIGKQLLEEGRKNLVFAGIEGVKVIQSQLDALKQVYEESGSPLNHRLILRKPDQMKQELRTILDFGVEVQALYVTGPFLHVLLPVLQEFKLDLQQTCRVVCEPFDVPQNDDTFAGLIREYQFDSEARLAMSMVERMIRDKDFRVETHAVPFQLRQINLDTTTEQ